MLPLHCAPLHPARPLLVAPSLWRRVAAAAAVVLLAAALWLVGARFWPTADPIPVAVPAHRSAVTAPVPLALAPPATVSAPVAARRAKASNAVAPKEHTEVEICGLGTVALAPDNPYPFQTIAQAERESALDVSEALMLASGDLQTHAAALWLGMQRGKHDAQGRVEQLARLAVGSQDPVVYALAVQACRGWSADSSGNCNLISRAQWAQLDPDNAVPWLELAAQARANNDVDAEEQALRMAAHARHVNTGEGVLPMLVDRALGTRVTPLQRTLALSESWSAQAVWTVSQALHLNISGGAKRAVPPDVELDLSCDSVNRMQDWMRQRSGVDGTALAYFVEH